jgi:catechol 2,3-dioxygenase-like lactoylglutathione lyase family enzyme
MLPENPAGAARGVLRVRGVADAFPISEADMGVLETASIAVVICTRDRARSVAFYRDVLGLRLVGQDDLAAIFDCGGTMVSISAVPDFVAHEHTIMGFRVADVAATVAALRARGVAFKTFAGFGQDELGILTLPGGAVRVAWLTDPDGNLLSVTNV